MKRKTNPGPRFAALHNQGELRDSSGRYLERVRFPTDKDDSCERHRPLTAAQQRALMCWAQCG